MEDIVAFLLQLRDDPGALSQQFGSNVLDAKFQQAQDNIGTGAKDVTGKAIVQIVKATGDNKQALINVKPEDLDTVNGFGFVRLSVTVGTAAGQTAAQVEQGWKMVWEAEEKVNQIESQLKRLETRKVREEFLLREWVEGLRKVPDQMEGWASAWECRLPRRGSPSPARSTRGC